MHSDQQKNDRIPQIAAIWHPQMGRKILNPKQFDGNATRSPTTTTLETAKPPLKRLNPTDPNKLTPTSSQALHSLIHRTCRSKPSGWAHRNKPDRAAATRRGGITGITFELLLEEDLAGDGGDGGEREQCRDGARRSPADRHPRRRPRRELAEAFDPI